MNPENSSLLEFSGLTGMIMIIIKNKALSKVFHYFFFPSTFRRDDLSFELTLYSLFSGLEGWRWRHYLSVPGCPVLPGPPDKRTAFTTNRSVYLIFIFFITMCFA